MTSRQCPDCDFIFLGEDAPDEGCPECGAIWSSLSSSTQIEEPPVVEDSASELDVSASSNVPESSTSAAVQIVRPLLLLGLLLTTVGWIWQSFEIRKMQRNLDSVTEDRTALQEKLQQSRERLNKATTKLVSEKEATQNFERQFEQLQVEYQEARKQFSSERQRLIELERSLATLWQRYGHSHIRSWQIVGPFPFVVPSEETSDSTELAQLTAVETGIVQNGYESEAQFFGLRPNLAWQPFLGDHDRIDLRKACASDDKAAAFAISWLFNRQEQEALLSVGSDDGMKLWFNRKLVHNVDTHRSSSPGQEKIPVILKAGWNEILVRVDNRGGGDWNFYAEFRSPNNKEALKLFHTWIKPLTPIQDEP